MVSVNFQRESDDNSITKVTKIVKNKIRNSNLSSTPALLDIGAGFNYVVSQQNDINQNTNRLKEFFNFRSASVEVTLADGVSVPCHQKCDTYLSVLDTHKQHVDTQLTTFHIINGSSEIILGRESISKFRIITIGTDLAICQNKVLYKNNKSVLTNDHQKEILRDLQNFDKNCMVDENRPENQKIDVCENDQAIEPKNRNIDIDNSIHQIVESKNTDAKVALYTSTQNAQHSFSPNEQLAGACNTNDCENFENSIDFDHLLNISDGEPKAEHLVPAITPPETQEWVTPKLNPHETKLKKSVLDAVCSKGFTNVPKAPGLQLRLRELKKSDIIDNANDTHVFEVDLQTVKANPPPYSFSQKAYQRLPPEKKDVHDTIVDGYVKRGWWWPAEQTPDVEVIGYCEGFLTCPGLKGRSQKDRFVIDARWANALMPKCSSDLARVREVTGAVRVHGHESLVVMDISEMFNRLRIRQGKVLAIRVATPKGAVWLYTDRLCFGTSWAPACATYSILIIHLETQKQLAGSVKDLLLAPFVDDLTSMASVITLMVFVSVMISILSAVSMVISTKKFQCIACPDVKNKMTDILSERDINLPVLDQGKVLGVVASYVSKDDKPTLRMFCTRNKRLNKSIALCREAKAKQQINKRISFEIAGNAGYDCMYLHAEERAAADALRSLTGSRMLASWDQKYTWGSKKSGHHLDELDGLALDFILDWIISLSEKAMDCFHDSPVTPQPSDPSMSRTPIVLRASGDASRTGGAFCIHMCLRGDDEWVLIHAEAWKWTRVEQGWHSNRRELKVALSGMQCLSDLCERLRASQERPLKAFVFVGREISAELTSDNRPTVDWYHNAIEGKDAVRSSRAIERRALARLIQGLIDESEFLQTVCTDVDVKHIEGASNDEPDYLSRLYDHKIGPNYALSQCLADVINRQRPEYSSEGATDPVQQQNDELFLINSSYNYQSQSTRRSQYSSKPIPDWLMSIDESKLSLSWLMKVQRFRVKYNKDDDESPMEQKKRNDPDRTEGPKYDTIELLASESCDVDHFHTKLARHKAVFQAWKGLKEKKKSAKYLDILPNDETTQLAVKLMQSRSRTCQAIVDGTKKLTDAGPLHLNKETGIVMYRVATSSGGFMSLFVVPRHQIEFLRILVRTAHNKTAHGGVGMTLATASLHYYTAGFRKLVRSYISECYVCMIKNASQTWCGPPNSAPKKFSYDALSQLAPFHLSVVDFVVIGQKRVAFTFYDVFSQCVEIVLAKKQNSAEAIRSVKTIRSKRPGMHTLLSDAAIYFGPTHQAAVKRECGLDWELFPSRSSWAMAGGAKSYYDMMQKFRAMCRGKFFKRLNRVNEDDLQEALTEIARILNAKPIGGLSSLETKDGSPTIIPVSPQYLADGIPPNILCITQNHITSPSVPESLAKVRQYYLNCVHRELKKNSHERIAERATIKDSSSLYFVGAAVLVKKQAAGKNEPPWALGHITEVLKGRNGRYRVIMTQGKRDYISNIEHQFNLCPLPQCPMRIGPSLVGAPIKIVADNKVTVCIHHDKKGGTRGSTGHYYQPHEWRLCSAA